MTVKKTQPNNLAGYFHGIDPATQDDYYTCVVHALMEKPRNLQFEPANVFKWTPYLVDAFRLKKRDPMEMTDIQVRIFNKYPPTFATIDSTREEFLSNAFIRKYGDTRIIPMKFGNVGQMNTKFKLKQIGYAYIEAGYDWPDPDTLEKHGFTRFARLVRILKKEMMLEQVDYTDTGRVTFKHPVGKHNDMVHGWEMSLNSVMEWQQRRLGFEKKASSAVSGYDTTLKSIYRKRGDKQAPEDAIMGPAVYDIQWRTPP